MDRGRDDDLRYATSGLISEGSKGELQVESHGQVGIKKETLVNLEKKAGETQAAK